MGARWTLFTSCRHGSHPTQGSLLLHCRGASETVSTRESPPSQAQQQFTGSPGRVRYPMYTRYFNVRINAGAPGPSGNSGKTFPQYPHTPVLRVIEEENISMIGTPGTKVAHLRQYIQVLLALRLPVLGTPGHLRYYRQTSSKII